VTESYYVTVSSGRSNCPSPESDILRRQSRRGIAGPCSLPYSSFEIMLGTAVGVKSIYAVVKGRRRMMLSLQADVKASQ
jgi:hypothetical protein